MYFSSTDGCLKAICFVLHAKYLVYNFLFLSLFIQVSFFCLIYIFKLRRKKFLLPFYFFFLQFVRLISLALFIQVTCNWFVKGSFFEDPTSADEDEDEHARGWNMKKVKMAKKLHGKKNFPHLSLRLCFSFYFFYERWIYITTLHNRKLLKSLYRRDGEWKLKRERGKFTKIKYKLVKSASERLKIVKSWKNLIIIFIYHEQLCLMMKGLLKEACTLWMCVDAL